MNHIRINTDQTFKKRTYADESNVILPCNARSFIILAVLIAIVTLIALLS